VVASGSPGSTTALLEVPKRSRSGVWVAGIVGGILLLLLLVCGGGGLLLAASRGSSPPSSPGGDGSTPGGATKGMAVAAATQIAGDHGFPKCDSQAYEPANTLHVLICNPPDGNGERVFFYTDQFVGTDAADPSDSLDFGAQEDSAIAIDYTLFKASDADCCPTGGTATVHFHWDGSQLKALEPIPTSDSTRDGSRR
jgi:hypothetical protein